MRGNVGVNYTIVRQCPLMRKSSGTRQLTREGFLASGLTQGDPHLLNRSGAGSDLEGTRRRVDVLTCVMVTPGRPVDKPVAGGVGRPLKSTAGDVGVRGTYDIRCPWKSPGSQIAARSEQVANARTGLAAFVVGCAFDLA